MAVFNNVFSPGVSADNHSIKWACTLKGAENLNLYQKYMMKHIRITSVVRTLSVKYRSRFAILPNLMASEP